MRFRPCIDIHNGKVKQIVGGTLCDRGDSAAENFVSGESAAAYARMYAADGLTGGHVILLNAAGSPYYEATKEEALAALRAAPGTLQVGGGINPENAGIFLDAGASHVIVTSYVFREGHIDYEALERMVRSVGREHLVLDLSARRKAGVSDTDSAAPQETGTGADASGLFRDAPFYVVTDRWQVFTREKVTALLLRSLAAYCSEFLIHGVDVEGKQSGPDRELLDILGRYAACVELSADRAVGGDLQKAYAGAPSPGRGSGQREMKNISLPVTYAGGIRSMDDIELIRQAGHGRVDFTVGSALDLFGGTLKYRDIR